MVMSNTLHTISVGTGYVKVIKEYVPVILHHQSKFLPIAEKQKQPILLKMATYKVTLDTST